MKAELDPCVSSSSSEPSRGWLWQYWFHNVNNTTGLTIMMPLADATYTQETARFSCKTALSQPHNVSSTRKTSENRTEVHVGTVEKTLRDREKETAHFFLKILRGVKYGAPTFEFSDDHVLKQ